MPIDYDLEYPQLLGMSAPAPETGVPAPLAQVTAPTPIPLTEPTPIMDMVQSIQQAILPLTSSSRQAAFATILKQQVEQRRAKKASDETQALTGMISTALASGNPEQLSTTITSLSKLKGLEPETVEALKKVQIDLGVKLQQDQQKRELGNMIGAAAQGNPQAQMLAKMLGAAPSQDISALVNAAKLAATETASFTEFKSLPEKLKTAVFTEATKMRISPDAMLKLAAQGDAEARQKLESVVDRVSGAAMDNNMYDRLTLIHFGPRGVTAPMGIESFGQLATQFPKYADQVVKEVQKLEAESAALQKGIMTQAQLETQLKVENAQPPKITQFWIDKKKLASDPGLPIDSARVMETPVGELRKNPQRYTELDDQQRRHIASFTGVEVVLDEIERLAPGLPKSGGAKTLINRVKFPTERFMGIAGMGTLVGTLQLGTLLIGKTFQGAASQLSDKDTAMASYANINDGDSQESIRQKVDIARRVSQRYKLASANVDIRPKEKGGTMPEIFSAEEVTNALKRWGAPPIPVPGTRAYLR